MQQHNNAPAEKKSTRTKLFLYFRTAAGAQEIAEFDDKVQLDAFIEGMECQPICVIRGNMKRFKTRVVFA